VNELSSVLIPDEIIAGCCAGRYEGGFALLTVTNLRILLVDKKPMFLTLEDIRFDMVSQIDFSSFITGGSLRITTPNRVLTFSGWNAQRLRDILNYTQQRVMEIRQPHLMQQFAASPRHHSHAPLVGGLAMQLASYHSLPLNPYTRVPLLMRRRTMTVPRFY
jgi:hypothetical protein